MLGGGKMISGRILSNRYEIIEEIGQGGMAIVYKGKDLLLNRNVAIKILRKEFIHDEQFIKKFKRESQSAASLSHHNIVNIYDVGVEGDIHYIVMELVKGQTLKELIRKNVKLSWERSIRIAQQIASALEHAHKNHIIHRDIKPHNIILTEDGIVKVADFGIARAITSSTITQVEDTMGSVHYLSPEQARGGFVNERSDLYSLGIVIYEMITGEVPFKGDTSVSVAIQHLQDEAKPPIEINSSIPIGLNNIILKLLNKNPDERYANATELISDLNRVYLNPEMIINRNNFDENAPTQITPIIKEDPYHGDADEANSKADKKESKKGRVKLIVTLVSLFLVASTIGALVFSLSNLFAVKEVEVPDVINRPIEEAIKMLTDVDLEIETERVNHNEVPRDHVISQDPEPGKIIKKNQTVKLVVSNGPKQVMVPDLRGKYEVEATNELDNLGLEVGEIKYEFNDEFENGIVYDQSPNGNVEVREGTKIDLFVSKGKETIKTPSLVGLHLEDAKEKLNSAGLNIGEIKYKESESYDKDHVVDQNPKSGDEIIKNAVVDITLSRGRLSTKIVEVNLNNYEGEPDESVKVTIELIDYQDNTVKEVYKENHTLEEGLLQIPVKGTGFQVYTIKINDKKFAEGFISF